PRYQRATGRPKAAQYQRATAAKAQPAFSTVCSALFTKTFFSSMPRCAKAASTMARTLASASSAVARPDHSMMTPYVSSLMPTATAAAMVSPGSSLVMAPYAVGVSAPGGMSSYSTSSAAGGKMLLTRSRFKLPMPAASSALSNALSVVGPSAAPATRVNFFGVGSNA